MDKSGSVIAGVIVRKPPFYRFGLVIQQYEFPKFLKGHVHRQCPSEGRQPNHPSKRSVRFLA
jgi:hypothetical protein